MVIDNCIGIAKDKVGCCVLQQCVDYCYGETKGRLIAAIIEEALILAQDRYGFVPMKLYLLLQFDHDLYSMMILIQCDIFLFIP